MEHLYAPWRSEYFSSDQKECVFCEISSHPSLDRQNKVFYRDDKIFCVMNKYPYTPGHFLIIPHFHTHTLENLHDEIWQHLQCYTKKGSSLLERFGANGINLGMNIQKAGGAGIPEHIHMHLVPRFLGDTNFITSINNTRIYGVNFDEIFEKIKNLSEQIF